MERFIAILLLGGGLAGAAAFAHRAGAPPEPAFAAPFAQPASHGAASQVLTVEPFPVAHAAGRPSPVIAPRTLRLAAPVRQFLPAPTVVHVVQAAASAQPARPVGEPAAPVTPPAPVPAPAPAPAPAPPAPAAPVVAPVVPTPPAPTAHDHGNGKDKGKANGKNKDGAAVTPIAETAAPEQTVTTVTTVTATTPEVAPAPVPPPAPATDDQHGRGHDKDK